MERQGSVANRTSVLLADDHLVLLEGLARLLQEQGFDIAGIARDGWEMVDIAKRLCPDVVVTDVSMPRLNGIDAARILRKEKMSAKVLFLSMHADHLVIREAFRAGASGYILKTCKAEELVKAIRSVARGAIYITPALSGDLMATLLTAGAREFPAETQLTLRRREVLQLLAEGKTMKEIAVILGISTRTAEAHKYESMRQLGVQTTAALIRYAVQVKLV